MKKIKFFVESRDSIKDFRSDEKYVVISIRDPNSEFAEQPQEDTRICTLHLAFSDIDKPIDHPEAVLMRPSDAYQIVRFYEQYKNKVSIIVVNCEAGICRSSAVAAALAKINGQDDDFFFKKYLPNRFVYRLILEEFHK